MIKLTLKDEDDAVIYVSPEHIELVDSTNGEVFVQVAGEAFSVVESASDIVAAIHDEVIPQLGVYAAAYNKMQQHVDNLYARITATRQVVDRLDKELEALAEKGGTGPWADAGAVVYGAVANGTENASGE